MPEVLSKFKSLNSLSMIYNNVRSFPETLGGLEYLRYLDLSYNKMREVPEGVGRLSSLYSLGLYSNLLNTLTNVPSKVQYLNIRNNYIAGIPEEPYLPSLYYVYMDNNFFKCSTFNSWSRWTFYNNCNQQMQNQCENKTTAECENLQNNYGGVCFLSKNKKECRKNSTAVQQFCSFADDAGIDDCTEVCDSNNTPIHGFYCNLNTEKLAGYRPKNSNELLKEVPESARNLTSLKTLSLVGLNLTKIPESYANFANVTVLDLGWNNFTEIPSVASKFTYLTQLSITHNKLTTLSEEFFAGISNIYNFRLFNASNNHITDITDNAYSYIKTMTYTDFDLKYNLLNCSKYSTYICSNREQFVCTKMDNEACAMASNLCRHDESSQSCLYIEESNSKISIGLVVFIVIVVAIIIFITVALISGKIKASKEKKKKEKEAAKKNTKKSSDSSSSKKNPELEEPLQIDISDMFEMSNVTPSKPSAPSAPSAPTAPTAGKRNGSVVGVMARMETSKDFYNIAQQGLNYIPGLFAPNEHMLRKDLLGILQHAGCSADEGSRIVNTAVTVAGQTSCRTPFTMHDAEVLALFTYDYGTEYRMKSPGFKLCYAMSMCNETDVRANKDFLYLILTALRRLPFTPFSSRPLYFAMRSPNASAADFPVGNVFKIMPFLTLFGDRNLVLRTLEGSGGVIFAVTMAEGYDVTKYSQLKPDADDATEVVMEPESVFRIESFGQVSESVCEVSLMYIREESEFPLENFIRRGNDGSGGNGNFNGSINYGVGNVSNGGLGANFYL